MQTLEELHTELGKLNSILEKLLKDSTYRVYDDLSGLEYDEADPEAILLKEELGAIMYALDEVNSSIDYLSRPIQSTGKLHKGSNGRYTLNNIELSSGYDIEVLIPTAIYIGGEWQEGSKWITSHIEHNGADYIIADYKGELEGLTARVRERR